MEAREIQRTVRDLVNTRRAQKCTEATYQAELAAARARYAALEAQLDVLLAENQQYRALLDSLEAAQQDRPVDQPIESRK